MFARTVRENLLAIARAYAAATGLSLSVVLRRAYGSGVFMGKIKGGGNVSIDKVDEMLRWFRARWPREADWPFLPTIYMNRRNRGK
jgi:hypothetical protein